MIKASKEFRSEAQLVRRGRQLIRRAIQELTVTPLLRYEVQAPGVIPDLVLFTKRNADVRYVVTVEFKLSNWRRALSQAFRHRNFGNEVYVILDEAKSGPAVRQVAIFERMNIGLVTVGMRGTMRFWNYPEPQLPFSTRFSRSLAQALLAPRKEIKEKLSFTESTRGGVTLSPLRQLLASGDSTN